ncbi:MAG: tRNA-dihydrouridine synthase family protein, partial [Candidatus Magasanikbacteria bacterium]|nr:tRNA-dihydrouridine synthase family protein [Candidatus Magasanikbacteria bacterium]
MIDWNKTNKPIIALAPMADFTDKPFSLICKKFGAQVIFREMVSSDAIVHSNKKTLSMIKIDKNERPIIQQIFGQDPKTMAEAAKIIYDLAQPDGIDINMGCPATKLVKNFHGCALMKDPKKLTAIIQTVKAAVPCP